MVGAALTHRVARQRRCVADLLGRPPAEEILRRTGADAVMLGRGCQGRPWHAGVLAGFKGPEAASIPDVAVEHYRLMMEHYGADVGVRHARKHVAWYLDRHGAILSAQEKTAVMTSKDPEFVARSLHEALAKAVCGPQEEADRKSVV